MGEDERLAKFETHLIHLSGEMTEVKDVLKKIADVVMNQAVLEVNQNHMNETLERVFKTIEANSARIEDIERKMPLLILSSNWVFKGILAVMGLMSFALIGTIIQNIIKAAL